MSAAVSIARPASLKLEEAQAIVQDPNADPMLWAAANTIISLHTALRLREQTEGLLLAECEEKRREIDALRGVVR